MTAPAWLVRAYLAASHRAIEHGFGDAVAAAARYDYAAASRETARAARWGMVAAALGRLVDALGGAPPEDA